MGPANSSQRGKGHTDKLKIIVDHKGIANMLILCSVAAVGLMVSVRTESIGGA